MNVTVRKESGRLVQMPEELARRLGLEPIEDGEPRLVAQAQEDEGARAVTAEEAATRPFIGGGGQEHQSGAPQNPPTDPDGQHDPGADGSGDQHTGGTNS
jgi:hypothetical protein